MTNEHTSSLDPTDLEDELRELRRPGVADPRLVLRPQLLTVAQTIVEGGTDPEKIMTALYLAINGLGTDRYVQAAACLFGLAVGTKDLSHLDRRALARDHLGGEQTTFDRKTQNQICEDLTKNLITLDATTLAGSPPVEAMNYDAITELLTQAPPSVDDRLPVLDEPFKIDSGCFDLCPIGEEHQREELYTNTRERLRTWWHENSSAWFGSFFAFWFKTLTTPCSDIRYTYDEGIYDSERFEVKAPDDDKPKATVVSADPFYTDTDRKLHCGKTNWDFCHNWAEQNSHALFTRSTVFGLADQLAYPGLTAVHTLLCTSDGYILFALRSGPDYIAFLPDTWSVSFEEQVSVTPREHTSKADETVLDTIEAGLHEEWGLPPSAIKTSSCLALGREWIEVIDVPPKRILNFGVITAVILSIDLESVWRHLGNSPRIRDRDEHRAWAGFRFNGYSDVKAFLKAVRPSAAPGGAVNIWARTNALDLEWKTYEGGDMPDDINDFGLTPTSAVRLLLGTAWLGGLRGA
jgi:hypothetical protein